MKIIFLDIDGVLATHKQYIMNRVKFWEKNPIAKELKIPYPFDPKCVKIFNEILDETNADIVLSSDWKTHFDLTTISEIFIFNGVKKAPFDITTNDVNSFGNIDMDRAYQIGQYIQDKKITNYVVLDDLDVEKYLSVTNGDKKVVKTNDFEGLKQLSLKNKILKILNNG